MGVWEAAVPWVAWAAAVLVRSSAIVSRKAPINHNRAHAQDSVSQCNHGQLLGLGTSRERLAVDLIELAVLTEIQRIEDKFRQMTLGGEVCQKKHKEK